MTTDPERIVGHAGAAHLHKILLLCLRLQVSVGGEGSEDGDQMVEVSGAEYMGEVLATCCPSIDMTEFDADDVARERWETHSGLTGPSINFIHDPVRAGALEQWAKRRRNRG